MCRVTDTHHDTAACHGDVFKRLHAERPAAPLTLLGQSAHRRDSRRLNKLNILTFRSGNRECEREIVMLTRGTPGCHSGAEPPGFPHSGACCRGQGSLQILLPRCLLSEGCSPSHPGDQEHFNDTSKTHWIN